MKENWKRKGTSKRKRKGKRKITVKGRGRGIRKGREEEEKQEAKEYMKGEEKSGRWLEGKRRRKRKER